MGEFAGRCVFITGASRGQGRAHALHFAREGAAVIAVDIGAQIPGVPYKMAGADELGETVRLVRAIGAEGWAIRADVRNLSELEEAVDRGAREVGEIDMVIANAGIVSTPAKTWEVQPDDFKTVVDVDLVGAWNTLRATVPRMLERATRGSIVFTISGAGVKGLPNVGPYVAAKHGVVGLMRTAARELAPRGIRVNAVLPGNVNTDMFNNDMMMELFIPDPASRSREEFLRRAAAGIPMAIPYVEEDDVAEAVAFLCSERARRITGVCLPVDGGSSIP